MLIIIPARRFSQRMPGKNDEWFVRVGDEIWNLVDVAVHQATRLKQELVVVTTDYITHIGEHGMDGVTPVKWIYREKCLCEDDTPMEDVIIDVFQHLVPKDEDEGEKDWERRVVSAIPAFLLLQPTTPTRSIDTIAKAMICFERDLDALISIGPDYKPNGAFYFVKTEAFWKDGVYVKNASFYMMPWNESIDINYLHEFRVAQAITGGRVYGRD